MQRHFSERRLLLVIGAVQFVNVLDFMIVMPLGPDFSRELGIRSDLLGVVSGSYTATAAAAGIAGAFFLDRLPRRKALMWALTGLVLGTIAGAFATGIFTMVAARCVAGAFGGPATSLAMSIVADAVPAQRRGKALGAVMGAFAVASVLGVPAGLELARLGGWRLAFVAVALLGAVVIVGAWRVLPASIHGTPTPSLASGVDLSFLRRPIVVLSLSCTALAMMTNFALIPNLSAYLQHNLGYPRSRLGWLYLGGGVASFAAMRLAGGFADRIGPWRVAAFGTALYLIVVFAGFVSFPPLLPVLPVFVAFMVSSSFRMVPMNTLASRVPQAEERGRFMSAQSAVQHLASATGAILASQLLSEMPDGRLAGMQAVGTFSLCAAVLLPLLLVFLERRVRHQEQQTTNDRKIR